MAYKETDDGGVTLDEKPEEATEPPADDLLNFVPRLLQTEQGKKDLEYVAQKVVDDFDDGWEDSDDWREKRKTRMKLLVGDLDEKEEPFEDAANVHIPVMLERILRLVHRIYAELFPDRDFVFHAIPSKTLVKERAELITKHSNWQIRKDITDFYRQNRRALMEFITSGDCIMHSYYDPVTKRNRHELLNCEEFVIPYVWKTTMVDLSDVPYKIRVIKRFKHELLALEKTGDWANTEKIWNEKLGGGKPSHESPPGDRSVVRRQADKFEGRHPGESDHAAPYSFYEYHGTCKITGWKEERPVRVVVEPGTKTVVSMRLWEEDDRKDLDRWKRQTAEAEGFQQDMAMHAQIQAQEQQLSDRLMQPDVPPDEAMALQKALTPVAPPVPPVWMKEMGQEPEPPRKTAVQEFSHGVCIENVDGSLGLGIGLLLEPHNMSANIAASQFTDSATLANVATIIKPEGVKMTNGETRITPGMIHSVRGASAENLQSAFKVIQYPQANPQLLDVVKLSIEAADGVSSAPDVLSGEAGKANETYRGIATRVEQATKQLSVLAMNYLEMLNQVMKNNSRLNRIFLDETELRQIVDPRTQESEELEISRSLYEEDFDILFTADTRFASKAQKISEADELLGMVKAVPEPIAAVLFKPEYFHEAASRSLKARGFYDMTRFLNEPQQTPTPTATGSGTRSSPGPGAPGGPPPPPNSAPPGIPGPRPPVEAAQ